MMTTLCQLIMECRAIKGIDRLVLYGWAAQLEEGNDTLFCSKETVAESIGVSDDTVLRRTQALVKAGWLIETGEQKQWEFARTPVRIINVPVIVGLVEAQEKAPPHFAALPQAQPQIVPPQNAAQGSTGLSGSTGSTGSRFRFALLSFYFW
jgi:biotin operon repressor